MKLVVQAVGVLLALRSIALAEEQPKLTPGELARQMFYTTARIETYLIIDRPLQTGTGFFVTEKYDDGKERVFLVTCAHVVFGMTGMTFKVAADKDGAPDPKNSVLIKIEDLPTAAFYHADLSIDVAIVPVTANLKKVAEGRARAYVSPIGRDLGASSSAVKNRPLENLIFIGYPKGMMDTVNLSPIARRGTFATIPELDFNGKPLILIDGAVFPGSSGSPVFAYEDGIYRNDAGDVSFGSRIRLVGLISQAYLSLDGGEVQFVSDPIANAKRGIFTEKNPMNLGAIVKETAIFEVLDQWHRAQKIPLSKRSSQATQATAK
jgi:hypothetical protein